MYVSPFEILLRILWEFIGLFIFYNTGAILIRALSDGKICLPISFPTSWQADNENPEIIISDKESLESFINSFKQNKKLIWGLAIASEVSM